jgi:hypothetical protein
MKSKSEEKDKSHKNFVGKGYGKRNSEELPDRQGSNASSTKGRTKDQDGNGHGNEVNKGSEGAQGFGKYQE